MCLPYHLIQEFTIVNTMRHSCSRSHFSGVAAPRQTFLVTVADSSNGVTEVVAVEWAAPLSVRPPLFGISISPNKHTSQMIRSAGVFTVNVPSTDILKQTVWAGTHTGRRHKDKITAAGLTSQPSGRDVNAVSIGEAVASFECKVVNEIPVGNYVLFIGEVMSVDASDELFDRQRGAWHTEKIRSILRVAYDTYTTINRETLSLN